MNHINGEVSVGLVIIGVILIYYIYYYFVNSDKINYRFRRYFGGDNQELNLFLFKKFAGFVILGVVPAAIYFGLLQSSGDKFGISFNHFSSSYLLIAGLILLTAVVLFFHHKKNPERGTSQLSTGDWNVSVFMLNAVGWSFYLIAYEFLFRGILLFECYEMLGFWPAVAINISLYSAIHMVYGKDQTIGSLIFGSIACYFALSRGTILIPIFMHLSLSILSDLYAMKRVQNIKLISENPLNTIDK